MLQLSRVPKLGSYALHLQKHSFQMRLSAELDTNLYLLLTTPYFVVPSQFCLSKTYWTYPCFTTKLKTTAKIKLLHNAPGECCKPKHCIVDSYSLPLTYKDIFSVASMQLKKNRRIYFLPSCLQRRLELVKNIFVEKTAPGTLMSSPQLGNDRKLFQLSSKTSAVELAVYSCFDF